MPTEEFVRTFNTSPSLDTSVPLNPYFDAVVIGITPDSDVLLEAVIEDGKQLEDSLGTTEISVDGDKVIASLQPKIGSPFELKTETVGLNGRIIRADKDTFTVDFNHPLAGKKIILDLEVVSLTKASQLKKIDIPWLDDHDKGLDLAMEEKKPAVLLLYAEWCGWSKRIMHETFQHPFIKVLKDEFIWLRINSDKERMFYDIYEQKSYPMIVFLDSHSQVINKINGFIDARSLRKELNHCLEAF
jgi:thioredoxin-related protein